MPSRRQFLSTGFSAVAAGLMGKPAWADCLFANPGNVGSGVSSSGVGSSPFAPVALRPASIMIDGLPFEPWFTGDSFQSIGEQHVSFPPFVRGLEDIPDHSESVEVCVIGGGLSGLAAAYMLRDLHPVLLDIHERFGGTARGEQWAGHRYSLGNAYVITPDAGSYLDGFYRELGLNEVYALSEPPDPVALDGRLIENFWAGPGANLAESAPYRDYARVVQLMAQDLYPDIPFDTSDPDNQWILDLDQKTFSADLQARMEYDVPPLLQRAIDAYFYSSFGAGPDEISAAGGWNFLAAEEYGRWVFPGGTAYMAQALWQKLHDVEQGQPLQGRRQMLRGGCTALDVRFVGNEVQVTYAAPGGKLTSLRAKKVVLACPKFVARRLIHDIDVIDSAKAQAMSSLRYAAYLVVNVLLDRKVSGDFYDIFQLIDNSGDDTSDGCYARPVADVLNGDFAVQDELPGSVLTMYWPVPGAWVRYCMAFDSPLRRFAKKLTPQIDQLLGQVGLGRDDVRQIRLSRWGHAMPVAAPELIANGTIDHLRRPLHDAIYFVNQDNWALPAVENSVLDAQIMTDALRATL